MNSTDITLHRLLAVYWRPNFKRWKSHKVLLIEYFRRSALWAKALNATAEWPIIDFALRIDPTVRADNAIIEQWHDHLEHSNPTERVPDEMRALLEYALHWAAIANAQLTEQYHLPPPYDPILIMYERGGFFIRAQGAIEITSITAIARRGWQYYDKDIPYDNIDADYLDSLDVT